MSPTATTRESSRVDAIPEASEVVVLGVDRVDDFGPLIARPSVRILLVEPDPARLERRKGERAFAEALRSPRITVCARTSPGDVVEEWRRGRDAAAPKLVLLHGPNLDEARGRFFDSVRRGIAERERDDALDRGTLESLGALSVRNALENSISGTPRLPPSVMSRFSGRPGVLVSAGPSLDRNARRLRDVVDRSVILAVDTAVRPLANLGVRPHIVVGVDPRERNVHNLRGLDLSASCLVAELCAHPDLVSLPAASSGLVVADNVVADALDALGLSYPRLAMFGSVATASFELACRMGLDPIVFIGQDLAFTGGEQYSRNVEQRAFRAADEDEVRWEDDVSGQPVRTTLRLQAFRDWLEARMLERPVTSFVNATGAGILKRGVIQLDADEALERCSGTKADIAAEIASCVAAEAPNVPSGPKPGPLARLRSEIDSCQTLLSRRRRGPLKRVLEPYLTHVGVVRLVEILESRGLGELSRTWAGLPEKTRDRMLVRVLASGVRRLEELLDDVLANGGSA